jgi:hypothetical protein
VTRAEAEQALRKAIEAHQKGTDTERLLDRGLQPHLNQTQHIPIDNATSQSESRMPETGLSGLMSGDGKRGGA